jgi:hypothetical protein
MSRATILTLTAAAGLAIAPLAPAFAAASQHHASAPHAKVTHFSASDQSLSAAGGSVHLKVKTDHAKRCKFTLQGVSAPSPLGHKIVRCAAGAKLDANLPPNSEASAAKWKISVVALRHGDYRASKAKSVVISVAKSDGPPPPPTDGGGHEPPPPPGA